jgi:hypothetical protein
LVIFYLNKTIMNFEYISQPSEYELKNIVWIGIKYDKEKLIEFLNKLKELKEEGSWYTGLLCASDSMPIKLRMLTVSGSLMSIDSPWMTRADPNSVLRLTRAQVAVAGVAIGLNAVPAVVLLTATWNSVADL